MLMGIAPCLQAGPDPGKPVNILFCLSYPRAVDYILAAMEELSRSHHVYYFRYRQMASHYEWPDPEHDLRAAKVERLASSEMISLGEPASAHSNVSDTYSADFTAAIDGIAFDLAVLDESIGKLSWGSPLLYRVLRSKGIPTVACQEGAVEVVDPTGLTHIASNLGVLYDYCFCIGLWDQDHLLSHNQHLGERVFAVGLPSNDALARYAGGVVEKKHVLLLPSWTGPPAGAFQPMTDELIASCGVYDVGERAGLPVLIKEKARVGRDVEFKHLESDNVRVTLDESDLDRTIAESAYVIGAPTTLLFKAIQLRVPTAVLSQPYMGKFGALVEFEGFTDSSRSEVLATLREQEARGGTSDEFIERAIAGGSTFGSTSRFVQAILQITESPSTYQGPISPDGPLRQRLGMRFPRVYKRLQRYY